MNARDPLCHHPAKVLEPRRNSSETYPWYPTLQCVKMKIVSSGHPIPQDCVVCHITAKENSCCQDSQDLLLAISHEIAFKS